MKQNYVYKTTKKLLNSELLTKIFPIHDENDEEGCYAKNVTLNRDSSLVKSMVGYLNNRKWQINAGVFDDEQRANLAKEGLIFEESWVDTDDGKDKVMEGYVVKETDDLMQDLCAGVIMFNTKGEYKNMLYVGSATGTYPFVYFATDIIDAHCGEIVKALREEGFVRKTALKLTKKETIAEA